MVSLESVAKKVASHINALVSYKPLDCASFQQKNKEKPAESQDFFTLASRLESRGETFFLFESLLDEGCYGRYSVLGMRPVMRFKAEGNSLFVLDSEAKNKATDPRLKVEESALDGWVRGGMTTREMSVEEAIRKSKK